MSDSYHSDDYELEDILRDRCEARFQIFCLGRHKRVGASSPVSTLPDDLMRLIYGLVTDQGNDDKFYDMFACKPYSNPQPYDREVSYRDHQPYRRDEEYEDEQEEDSDEETSD